MIFNSFASQGVLDKLVNKKTAPNDVVWDNLCIQTVQRKYWKKVPETSFCILTNSYGTTHCKIDGKYFKLCNSTFIVLNPYQELEYIIDSKHCGVETNNIHFNFGFFLDAFRTMDDVLEQPFAFEEVNPLFFNELHYKDVGIRTILNTMSTTDDYDLTFMNIIRYLNNLKSRTHHKIQSIDSVKYSTKCELYARISTAKDIIYSEYETDLSIESISKRSLLSKYHLIRSFKSIYEVSPYQMLKEIRLEKAKEYLTTTSYSIGEIAGLVGYEEANSLSNTFKKKYGLSPSTYRISNFE